MIPADKAERARALVAGSSGSTAHIIPSSKDSSENDAKGADTATVAGVTQQGIRSGDQIVIRYLDDNKSAAYTLSEGRNDAAKGMLSRASPLGQQLLG